MNLAIDDQGRKSYDIHYNGPFHNFHRESHYSPPLSTFQLRQYRHDSNKSAYTADKHNFHKHKYYNPHIAGFRELLYIQHNVREYLPRIFRNFDQANHNPYISLEMRHIFHEVICRKNIFQAAL